MFLLPLFHNLEGAPVLVVGAGQTALRKIRWLQRAGASITVVAPTACSEVEQLADQGAVHWQRSRFDVALLQPETRLVIAATDRRAVNRSVYGAALASNIPINCVDDPELCTVVFPAIIDREPILVAVSSSGTSPTLARTVRGWIESRLPPRLGELAGLAGDLRERVRASLPEVGDRMRFWDRLFAGSVAERAFRGDLAGARVQALDELSRAAAAPSAGAAGSVTLVGAGPGDPELLTLKALRALQTADVILYDKLVNPKVLDYARRDAQRVYVGKQGPKPGAPPTRPDNRVNQQQSINARIIAEARAGKTVVRLKGGDPFIYGRGGEELQAALDAHLDVSVIPGITASMGAASYVGIPLTHRKVSESVRFVTGHRVENTVNLDWPEFAKDGQTLVIYMGLVGLAQIMQKLIEHGCQADRPVALVEHATLPEQKVVSGTVGTIAELATEAGVDGPSVVIVGDVVALSSSWRPATS